VDLGLDSLDGMELVMELEGVLGATIPDDALRQARTVEDLLRLLTGLLGRKDFS
jgi:acyl carrier protein